MEKSEITIYNFVLFDDSRKKLFGSRGLMGIKNDVRWLESIVWGFKRVRELLRCMEKRLNSLFAIVCLCDSILDVLVVVLMLIWFIFANIFPITEKIGRASKYLSILTNSSDRDYLRLTWSGRNGVSRFYFSCVSFPYPSYIVSIVYRQPRQRVIRTPHIEHHYQFLVFYQSFISKY